MTELSLRNVTCDYYMEKPNGFNRLRLRTNFKVPIIRMFGILCTGQKCCVHIHGVFPYIIVRTGVSYTPEFADLLRNRIGAMVAVNSKQRNYNVDFAIYDIQPITAKSLYGYHKNDETFVQIFFYNPLNLKIVVDALQKETIKNPIFQVYESHIPYILQFFIDHSIFGMDIVNFTSIKFRVSTLRNFSDSYYLDLKVEDIVSNMDLVSPLMPLTNMAVECDVFAVDIQNTFSHSSSAMSSNPGLNYIWEDEQRRCEKRRKEFVAECSQEERPAPDTERERGYLNRLHAFARRIEPSNFSNPMETEGSHALQGTSFEASDAMGDDFFETYETNVFDEELFLGSLDELKGTTEEDEHEYHDDDLSQKIDAICSSTIKSTTASGSSQQLIFSVSDTDDDDDCDGGSGGGSCSRTKNDISSSTSGVQRIGGTPRKISQGSANSDDLFDRYAEETSQSPSACNFGDSKETSLNSSCFSFSPKSSAQTWISNKTHKRDNSTELPQLDDFCTETEALRSAESYECDIESVWIPKRPRKIVLSEELAATSCKMETWLRPCKRLPFRKRTVPIEETEQEFIANDGQQSVESASCCMKENVAEMLFTDSFIEQPSFMNYGNIKEKLEQTFIPSSETPLNSEAEETDIRHLCVMSMEILALVSPGMPVPDPQHDQILGLFYAVSRDVCAQNDAIDVSGILLNMDDALIGNHTSYTYVASETDLFDAFVSIIQKYDPDIVVGYNALRNSWGYLVERSLVIGRNLLSEISRCPIDINDYCYLGQQNRSRWVKELDPTPRGRILINLWRILRYEVALRNYTMSNVVYNVLKRRFPEYSFPTLSEWIMSSEKNLIILVLDHMLQYCKLNLRIMVQLDLFTRTCEMARLYGIQFNEVFTRGSQFRVESMLLRLARQGKFVAPSISPAQRGAMCSPETIPLTMEPESGYYRDPVIVLDFQSLYPSIIIAYNYCFTTCFGKILNIENIATTGKIIEFGGLKYCCPIDEIFSMLTSDNLHISPTGATFCRKSVRKGLMPVMLEEILNTRVMVKKAAKDYKDNRRLSRILDARQFALKLIANVTYGYAAANFSGRMPCVEVADAIVSKGRETLERAIQQVNEGGYGNVRVIYGDTDSIFVLCSGSNRAEAFEIGQKIADDVTNANPNPVKLKLEKIMQPLILESKKRYVGMSYGSLDETEGIFDAKGIETVRRDSCPLVSRVLEKSLRLLFSGDMDRMVRYLDMQLSNLCQLPLSDFVFSREYRKSYAESAVVASKLIAEKRKAICPRDEPEVGERVPYVIVSGELQSTLISCVREPREFLADRSLSLNFEYYVQRQVLPSLQRAFDYIPLKIEWHCPSTNGCYKCKALGVKLWCKDCITDSRALFLAICDCYLGRRLLAQLNNHCRKCLALRSFSIDHSKCINMACMVKQKRILLDRSLAELAVRSHSLTNNEYVQQID